jgi:hypothetical protein
MDDPVNNGILFSSIGMVARKFQATFNLRNLPLNLALEIKAKTTLKFPMWNLKFLT